MNTVVRKVLRRIRAFFARVRVRDCIVIRKNGFWADRSAPSRSLKKVAGLFNRLRGETIIEIGTGIHGKMAGNSILVWTRRTCARRIIAVDLEEERIDEVKEAAAKYSNLEALVGDGIAFLREFPGRIDLLYLDFWTPDPEGELPGTGRAEAYREVYAAARDKMNEKSMILIDDTDHIHPWKHTYIVPEARKDGFDVVYVGRQTLMLR